MIRAKFKVDEVVTDEVCDGFTVRMSPVIDGSEENKNFWKYTPGGFFEMLVDNPDLKGTFEEGQEYYIDLSLAKQED